MNPFILDIISITWPLIIVMFLFARLLMKSHFSNYKKVIKELNDGDN